MRLKQVGPDILMRVRPLLRLVVVTVPILLGVPAVFMFVPPAMILSPAAFSHRPQFAALVPRLLAVWPMLLDGPIYFALCVDDAPLAMVIGLGMQRRQDRAK